jgi:4,5-DOPA dioxygenase extradiol
MKNSEVKNQPAMFVGHGNPMYAIESNAYTQQWSYVGNSLPKPASILCISAHWETRGTKVTAMPFPKTIHDFGGFPKELYEVEYPASGNENLSLEIIDKLGDKYDINADYDWGLDHGCWAVLKNMYPNADIPVVQLSLDRNKSVDEHYQLGQDLKYLRQQDVLIIGSGNIIHNLRMVNWENLNSQYPWAIKVNERLKKDIKEKRLTNILKFHELGNDFRLAIPTPEHFLPLIYILAMQQNDEDAVFFNDAIEMGSLSMTSFYFS